MNDNGLIIARNVKHLLKINNISDQKIAKAIGTTEEKMELFYEGKGFMSFRQLEIIAEMTNSTVMDILTGIKV